MTKSDRLASMSMPRKIIAGAGALLLINSFLPWYHISFGGLGGASATGWHGLGVIAWLLVLGLLVIEGSRIGGVLPLEEEQADLVSLAVAAGVAFFGLIYVIVRLTDGHLGFGVYIGIIGLAALSFGVVRLVQAGTATTALKGLKSSTGSD